MGHGSHLAASGYGCSFGMRLRIPAAGTFACNLPNTVT
ncbi:hypothetical protein CSIRO_4276 [Bradyrhizobiaceae bacterium SG-6C]|nr:hypothetical protein CSIRO_4276 [Bradyrhizobiaceae bacterium SG-6C]